MTALAAAFHLRVRRIAGAAACVCASVSAMGCTTDDEARAVPDTVYISAAGDTLRFPLLAVPGAAAPRVRAVLTARDSATELYMDIGGVEPRMRLQIVLNRGPCADAEQPVADIGPVIADPSGTASFRTTIPTPLPRLADGAHALQLHDLGDGRRDFPPLACAPIPSR